MFKFKEKDYFNYDKFLYQISINSVRKHLLTDDDLIKYFLKKIDKKYNWKINYKTEVGSIIDDYNWDLIVYENNDLNTPIINSKYTTEYLLYKELYTLIKKGK